MKKEDLILKWKKNGKKYAKEIERKKFFNVMKSIRDAFDGNNEISNIFCQYVPDMDVLYIDKDRNNDVETPFVQYSVNEERCILNIKRSHKIIWAILNGYTKN